MLRRVALVRTDVSEELSASFISVTSIRELGTTLAVTSNRLAVTMMEALSSSETSVLTRATWRNIPEDAILHSHRRENFKFYIVQVFWNVMCCLAYRCRHSIWEEPKRRLHIKSTYLKAQYRIVQPVDNDID
jgi:hypothetical protein